MIFREHDGCSMKISGLGLRIVSHFSVEDEALRLNVASFHEDRTMVECSSAACKGGRCGSGC